VYHTEVDESEWLMHGVSTSFTTSTIASVVCKRPVAMFAMIKVDTKRLVTALVTWDCFKRGMKIQINGMCPIKDVIQENEKKDMSEQQTMPSMLQVFMGEHFFQGGTQ
jgi:hypothetical protein